MIVTFNHILTTTNNLQLIVTYLYNLCKEVIRLYYHKKSFDLCQYLWQTKTYYILIYDINVIIVKKNLVGKLAT